jgi:3-oxoacyl-[acyl-carrier-protein] synthase II
MDTWRAFSSVTGNQSKVTEIAVTGLGATTPLGGDVPSTWAALLEAASGTVVLEDEWARPLPVRLAARLRREPAEVLDRVQMRRMDRSQQIAVVAAREAWADAGAPDIEPERFAVVIGSGVGGMLTILAQHDVVRARGPHFVSPFAIPMSMPNGAAAAVSLDLGARAGAHAPVSACASGAEAIAMGMMLLRAGHADIVVAGGTEACVTPLTLSGFARMGALSSRMDDPSSASRPFDSSRDGFVLGEGAGAIVLERADHARARGARIRGRLAGVSVTSDAVDMTRPDHMGQVRALKQAMTSADLGSSDIGYINAHATGTPTGDRAEADAVAAVIGTHPLVSATKASTGHLIGGAGAVEAIFTVLALTQGTVPPTRNLQDQDPEIKLDIVTAAPRRATFTAALSNSFGFGGHNVVLAFTAV